MKYARLPWRSRRELMPRPAWDGQPPVFSPPGADLTYSGVIHDSWREFFRALPADARVLDIAAGIGAVSLIASEVSQDRGRGFEIHSLDQAATLQAEATRLNDIRFHAHRYDESTPFDDGYFDGITFQWAPPVEDGRGRLAELRRILRPDGWLRFTFHARGSTAYDQSLARIRAVDEFLDEIRLLEHARRLFEVAYTHERALKRDVVSAAMQALESHSRYTDAAERCARWSIDTPNPAATEQVLKLIAECWERRRELGREEVMARLVRVEGSLRAAQARLRAVCALSMDETQAHRLGRSFRDAGFEKVKVKALKVPGKNLLLGWDLTAA